MSIASGDHVGLHPRGWSSTNIIKILTGGQGRPAAILLAMLLVAFHVWLGDRYWAPARHTVFDAYQRLFPREVEQLPVVIVDIDDASLVALGQWPWPRTRLARLIEATRQMGALVIGLDMVMPEVDRTSPSVFVAERPELSPSLQDELAKLPSNEAILAETLRRVPSVIGRVGTIESGGGEAQPDWQTAVRVYGEGLVSHVPTYAGHLTNVPPIEDAVFGRGYINVEPDPDGVVRAVPLLVAVQGKLAPTLALELLRVAAGEKWYSVHGNRKGIRGVEIGTSFIPTDPDGRIRLYYSPPDPRRRVSALAILKGEVDAAVFLNKVALIGLTAVGLQDVAATPVSALMDGVEIQAQVVENMLDNTRLVRPSTAHWLELLGFLMVAALLITLLPRLKPGHSVMVFFVAAAVLSTVSIVFFVQSKLLFDPSFPVGGIGMILAVLMIVGFAVEQKDKRFLRKTFGAYLSPELIEEMVQTKTEPKLGGSSGTRTAYFTDIASFSSFSEILSAAQLVELLNEYLTIMTDILLAEGGTLDKYEGDAIVAFFGAPIFQPDHAARSLRTALGMQQQLARLHEKWSSEGGKWPDLVKQMRMRIGINSGEIITGNMGSRTRMNYTMMGDAVNTAARLEGAAKQYGTYILCSTDTLRLAGPDEFAWRSIDRIRVVGKSEPVDTVEIMALKGRLEPDRLQMCALYHRGLELYRQQKWDEAKARFVESEKLEEVFPGRLTNPSRVYIARCDHLKANPPGADWDGTWILTS